MPAGTIADALGGHTSRGLVAFLEIGAIRTGTEDSEPALSRIEQVGGTSNCLVAKDGATIRGDRDQ